MAKFEKITLKDREIVETEEGDFEERFLNERHYPAAITNYGLNIGEKMGLLEGSNLTDLLKLANLEKLQSDISRNFISEESMEASDEIDIVKYLKVIYIALIGINKNLQLSFDEFTEKYHDTTPTIMQTYTRLVMASLSVKQNKFAEGLQKSTKKK
ncbi:hypothetical protein ACFFGV_19540 [Pontibacillus salicampi]|uniref:Tail assembly chaperone n=1 Tax=Pontibacillus salicampi TaxID=1449801 RepID=A0ABV6LTP2_9BACI